jgi:hypothetical protein
MCNIKACAGAFAAGLLWWLLHALHASSDRLAHIVGSIPAAWHGHFGAGAQAGRQQHQSCWSTRLLDDEAPLQLEPAVQLQHEMAC